MCNRLSQADASVNVFHSGEAGGSRWLLLEFFHPSFVPQSVCASIISVRSPSNALILGIVAVGTRKYIDWASVLHRYVALFGWMLAMWITVSASLCHRNRGVDTDLFESGILLLTPVKNPLRLTTTRASSASSLNCYLDFFCARLCSCSKSSPSSGLQASSTKKPTLVCPFLLQLLIYSDPSRAYRGPKIRSPVARYSLSKLFRYPRTFRYT